VEVPDLSKGRLALSSIVMGGTPGGADPDPDTGPAVRRFHRGATLSYAFVIYNSRVAPASERPRLRVSLTFYREGSLVQSMPAELFAGGDQLDPKRLAFTGSLRLGETMAAGWYTLQAEVQDLAVKARSGRAAQSMDFEVVD
jgi:hypothetical protein